jgi:hypothetical protein
MRDRDGWIAHPRVPTVRYRRVLNSDDHEIQDVETGQTLICGISTLHCEETTILSGPGMGEVYSPCPCFLYDPVTNMAYLLQRYNFINVVWMLNEKGFDPEAWKDIVIRSDAGRDWL